MADFFYGENFKMKIIKVLTADLIPYENNPRKNDKAVDVVKKSIEQFGFKEPIVIDKNNVIVCGHTRLKAAKKLKLEKVPCVVADDLSPDQIKAFRLIDNKTAELATWDYSLLEKELSEIDIPDFDIKDFQFDISDLNVNQNLDNVEEIKTENISKEKSFCTCPQCGFKFKRND